ncbi:hypothetical protein D9M71_709410 [compost metagenome]
MAGQDVLHLAVNVVAVPVQLDQKEGGHLNAQLALVQDRDLGLDDACALQAPDPPVATGGRQPDAVAEQLQILAAILLQLSQNFQIHGVCHFSRVFLEKLQ